MKLNKLIAIATISLLSGGISMAQKALNLEDIVAGNVIQTKGVGSMTWLKDGERYSRLENNKQTGGTDIVAYQAKDNSREVIIPSSLLTDKSTGKPIPVRSISWSADNEKVLIYNNTQRVWRYDTRGDYWVLNLKDGALRQLGKGMPESSMMFAKFSPDGTRVAYVSNNNIYVEDIDSGKITQLTKDGSDTIVNGTFDWVYEEEFSCRDGFRWSPDGKYIAYSCKKKAGKEYAFSTNTEIYIYNVADGSCNVIPMGGGYDTEPTWSPDGQHIAWLSMARDGYEADKTRLMVADVADGKAGTIRDLTAGFKYNAAAPVWDDDSRTIYFNALAEGLQGLFKANVDGTISRITSDSQWCDYNSPFAVQKSDKGTTLLASWCSMDFPTELVSVSAEDGSTIQITKENEHILSQLADHKMEARMVKTMDGKDMLTWVMYPPQFDSTKVYPSILICLGGPQGTISQSWSYRWNYRLMAAQGYVVVLPNRRGTTAFGQEWCEQISGDYSGMNIQDYISAAKEMKAEPFIGKMAACGASYGGYSVYYLAGVHENLFDCFIAHAGIFDEKYMYYETEEMWFCNWDNGGMTEFAYTPGQTGPAGDGITFGGLQQAGSPWSSAAKAKWHYTHCPADNVTKWNTPILCIHGGMDFRIPYDQGMAAFNAAQMMGVPSKLIVFPDECHWILKPQNALFWHREYFDWLDKWCK